MGARENYFDEWVRTDEREDVINALEHCLALARTLNATPRNWKWLLIALHNALQGALVCTLSGSANVGALSDPSFAEVLNWLENSRSDPSAPAPKKEWLANLTTLYERAKKPDWMCEFGGQPLVTTEQQDDDIRRLNDLRNGFMHFTPRGWSIERVGLPRISVTALKIVDTLLTTHPANTFRFDQNQMAQIKSAIVSLVAIVGSDK
jgi:hypothetical protein